MNVYVDYIEDDAELTREGVAEETDPQRLLDWLEEQEVLAHELSVMCGTMKLVDSDRIVGMSRKLGYVRISINWIRKRLAELDVDAPDYVVSKKERRQARQLTEQANALAKMKLKLANERLENERLRAKIRALAAQGMSAGTAKTAQPVEGEARQPGDEVMRPDPSPAQNREPTP